MNWPHFDDFGNTGCLICIWTFSGGCLEVTGWLKIVFFNSSEKFMQIPLKVNKIYFLWHQAWPHNDLLLLKSKTLKLHFSQSILDIYFVDLKNVKDSQFWCHFFQKKIRSFLIILFMLDLSTPASPADFHCNLFWWFVTILAFVDLSKLGILTDRGCPVFLWFQLNLFPETFWLDMQLCLLWKIWAMAESLMMSTILE